MHSLIHLKVFAEMHVVFDSCNWVASFFVLGKIHGKIRKVQRDLCKCQGKCGHLRRDRRVHKVMLLVHVIYPVAVVSG